MNKLNSKGFSPLHILLLIVIVGMIGSVGYYVYNSQKKTNTSLDNSAKSQTDPQKSEKKEEAKVPVAGEKKTVSYNGYSYNYTLPDGWTAEEKDMSGSGEYNVYIFSPDKMYRLNLKTFNANKNGSEQQTQNKKPYKNSFAGVNGKTNYVDNLSDSEPNLPPALHISACEKYFCHNELGPDKSDNTFMWFLGVYIERAENINASVAKTNNQPIDLDNETVEQMLGVIGTVKY